MEQTGTTLAKNLATSIFISGLAEPDSFTLSFLKQWPSIPTLSIFHQHHWWFCCLRCLTLSSVIFNADHSAHKTGRCCKHWFPNRPRCLGYPLPSLSRNLPLPCSAPVFHVTEGFPDSWTYMDQIHKKPEGNALGCASFVKSCTNPWQKEQNQQQRMRCCLFGHKAGFRALSAQPVSSSRGAGADTALLSISAETKLKLGCHWCCLCPTAQIFTIQRRQGRKETPLSWFYRGRTAGLSDFRVTRVGSGCWTLLNAAQTKITHRDSSRAAFDKETHWENLGCVSG